MEDGAHQPLLGEAAGNRPGHSKRGLLKVTGCLLGYELFERLAFYGLASNLIVHLTDNLHLSNSAASTQIQNFWGFCYVTPVLGAYLADAYLGRYLTILIFSMVYIMGFACVSAQAALPALLPPAGQPEGAYRGLFFLGLYLVAFGSGMVKACVTAFGGDQFRQDVPEEKELLSRFFSFFYLAINIGSFVAVVVVVYIQQHISWAIGFSICTASMLLAVLLFSAATSSYTKLPARGSPFSIIARVLAAAWAKRRLPLPQDPADLNQVVHDDPEVSQAGKTTVALSHTSSISWLDHAAIIPKGEDDHPRQLLVSVTEVEEVKMVLQLLPLLAIFITYNLVLAQMNTMFILQGESMDTRILGLDVPAASMGVFDTIACILGTILYDSLIAPAFKQLGRPISNHQQIGTGLLISALTMAAAAGLEVWRLHIVRLHHLEDVDPREVPVPLSLLWQLPQYFLAGLSQVFANVGAMELFYSAAPSGMRSVASALMLLSCSLGSYCSSLFVLLVELATSRDGSGGWVAPNMNRSRLDFYYLLLMAVQLLGLLVFLLLPRRGKASPAGGPGQPEEEVLLGPEEYEVMSDVGRGASFIHVHHQDHLRSNSSASAAGPAPAGMAWEGGAGPSGSNGSAGGAGTAALEVPRLAKLRSFAINDMEDSEDGMA